ncbi:putative uncharacterized protein DDB_G0277003 isoform X2 [Phalaenopsis equestris]|uniref:putative uncharacterized protein DDB_G0277003 isoform X2 n=1 Tax=Phalaenopsis equestris TaxID=78828 RepID=UPI0009E1D238|nr:putative uncharacterized protein DDB_G0277003 isoform X2 [Phalaenopsis equestris]
MAVVSDTKTPNLRCLKAAFLAMEPSNCLISLARRTSGGSLTEEVQNFILELCVNSSDISCNLSYMMNILKKVIVEAESTCEVVVEGLYEQFAKIALLQVYVLRREENRILKKISFFLPSGIDDRSSQRNLVVSLYCSLNLLEDVLSGLHVFFCRSLYFLTQSCSRIRFALRFGWCCSCTCWSLQSWMQVILTDGDGSTLENMKCNLELNHLRSGKVQSRYLPWEFAAESELLKYEHDCVLGADIIYDPKCVPHLIEVLRMLLKSKRTFILPEEKEASVAYLATVIRNKETFNYFLRAAEEAHLSVMDITQDWQPLNLLPYMLSYDRTSVCLYRIS